MPSRFDIGTEALFGANRVQGRVERFEFENGPNLRLVDSEALGAEPFDVAYGEGYVWVVSPRPEGPADKYVVTTFDAGTLEKVSSFGVPSIAHLEFGYGWLWVGTNEGLWRVDPETDERKIVEGIDFATDVSAGAGAVWAFGVDMPGRQAHVVRIDPEAARVAGRTAVGGFFGQVEADAEFGVWVLSDSTETVRTLTRVDPVSGRVIGEDVLLEGGVMEMTAGLGSLWVVDDSQQTLSRIGVDTER
jgi:hypothetical protein